MCAPWRIDTFRDVAQDDDDFVLHIEPFVAVVAGAGAVRHAQAIARENDFALRLAAVAEGHWPEVAVERKSTLFETDRLDFLFYRWIDAACRKDRNHGK